VIHSLAFAAAWAGVATCISSFSASFLTALFFKTWRCRWFLATCISSTRVSFLTALFFKTWKCGCISMCRCISCNVYFKHTCEFSNGLVL